MSLLTNKDLPEIAKAGFPQEPLTTEVEPPCQRHRLVHLPSRVVVEETEQPCTNAARFLQEAESLSFSMPMSPWSNLPSSKIAAFFGMEQTARYIQELSALWHQWSDSTKCTYNVPFVRAQRLLA